MSKTEIDNLLPFELEIYEAIIMQNLQKEQEEIEKSKLD